MTVPANTVQQLSEAIREAAAAAATMDLARFEEAVALQQDLVRELPKIVAQAEPEALLALGAETALLSRVVSGSSCTVRALQTVISASDFYSPSSLPRR